jgi:hypothetical protein
MPVRRLFAQALSSRPPTMCADHVGLGPGFIDEDAVDDPRIAGRASAKYSANVLTGRPEDTGTLNGPPVLLGWASQR